MRSSSGGELWARSKVAVLPWEHRLDSIGEAIEPIDSGDEDLKLAEKVEPN